MPRLDIKDKPTDSEIMPANTFGKLVAYVASRGYNPSSVIGTKPDGRTRMEIYELLREALSNGTL